MGTRSTIHIIEGKKTITSIYNQYDGYPSGLGQELKDLLSLSRLTNGFGGTDKAPYVFNGLECLGAYIVGFFKFFRHGQPKDGIGGCYMTDSKDRQEYNYFLTALDNKIRLKLTDHNNKTLFNGLIQDFEPKNFE